jgi:hypothetical protein
MRPMRARVQIAESSWDVAGKICRFLDLFNHATQVLSSESVPSIASVSLVFHRIRVHVRECMSCQELVGMAAPMMEQIESYADFYSNAHLAAAALLDPRIRPVLETYDQAACGGGKRVLEGQFLALASHEEAAPVAMECEGLVAFFPPDYQHEDRGNALRRFFECTGMSCHTEPLQWWASNGGSFPTLAKIARKYLTIQATSASSERLFSTAGMILSPHRSRLQPEPARELICLHNWLRALEK